MRILFTPFIWLVFAFLITISSVSAQRYDLIGSLTDSEGELLSFASVYVKGTTHGTTTNLEGAYQLPLDPGEYEIQYQYVGYKTQSIRISMANEDIVRDVVMDAEAYSLDEVVIAADGEDPAYQIIRNAMAKRKYHKDQVDSFSCKVYVKGIQEFLDSPKKVMGQSVGDLDGALDSTGRGIVYLSESVSEYYYRAPGDKREIMVSSKLSGDDQGYSFNSAFEMDINLYDNTIDFNRHMINPIASNAMNYYDYELIGTEYNDEGLLLNKIKIIPKRKYDPVFSGVAYVIEDQWSIHSGDLNATGESLKMYFLDTLNFKVQTILVEEPDVRMTFSNTASFKMGALGFKVEGAFSSVFTDYDLTPTFEKDLFGKEVVTIQKEANKRDSSYWSTTRPVPLTDKESVDYERRDSIRIVRNDPVYLDSVDRINNRFKIGKLLSGYTYSRRSKRFRIGYETPITSIGFNTVQGYNFNVNGEVLKYYDEARTKRILIVPNLSYGFSEKKLRASGSFEYRMNRLYHSRLGIAGGSKIVQFDELNPISPFMNSAYSLVRRQNYMKLYEKNFIRLYGQHEFLNGTGIAGFIEYTDREVLFNNSSHSYFEKDRNYTSNWPTPEFSDIPPLDNPLLRFQLRMAFSPGEKYYRYPNRKFTIPSKLPNFYVSYSQGIDTQDGTRGYKLLQGRITKSYDIREKGTFRFWLNGGTFLGDQNVQFVDRKHFQGNQVIALSPYTYYRRFLRMPYYGYSTADSFFQMHLEHNFNGWILDKTPVLNQLGWNLVAGYKLLKVAERPSYMEVHAGLDNIGVGLFRLLRFDVVWSKPQGRDSELGFVIGVSL